MTMAAQYEEKRDENWREMRVCDRRPHITLLAKYSTVVWASKDMFCPAALSVYQPDCLLSAKTLFFKQHRIESIITGIRHGGSQIK